MDLPLKIQRVKESMRKIPGVGEKTALRYALHLASRHAEELKAFGENLVNLASIDACQFCRSFSDREICNICANEERWDSGSLCVVESISDVIAIERSRQFRGTYFVLGGVLNPLLGVGPEELNVPRLRELIANRSSVRELVIAINPSLEGDATSSYLREILPPEIKVHRIGFGIPIGGALEYLDSMTISKAFENKTLMQEL